MLAAVPAMFGPAKMTMSLQRRRADKRLSLTGEMPADFFAQVGGTRLRVVEQLSGMPAHSIANAREPSVQASVSSIADLMSSTRSAGSSNPIESRRCPYLRNISG